MCEHQKVASFFQPPPALPPPIHWCLCDKSCFTPRGSKRNKTSPRHGGAQCRVGDSELRAVEGASMRVRGRTPDSVKLGNHAKSWGINKPKEGVEKEGLGKFSLQKKHHGQKFVTSYVNLTEKMQTHLSSRCGPWFVPGAMSRRGDGSCETWTLHFGNWLRRVAVLGIEQFWSGPTTRHQAPGREGERLQPRLLQSHHSDKEWLIPSE